MTNLSFRFLALAFHFLILAPVTQAAASDSNRPIYILHVRMGNGELSSQVQAEISRAVSAGSQRKVVLIRPNLNSANNPFAVTTENFATGHSRSQVGQQTDPVPLMTETQLKWFESQINQDMMPDVFIINGHHIPGMGFHSDEAYTSALKNQQGENLLFATQALYTPTLHQSIAKYPILQKYFSRVKLVFIGGCWGLSNLEPREDGDRGNFLSPEQIQDLYKTDRARAIGNSRLAHSLEYQRHELATIYSGDFTRNSRNESCANIQTGEQCDRYHADRTLPDYGLWDGSHMFNQPLLFKRSFPNAVGVFGFHRPSPRNPGPIWAATFAEARQNTQLPNILLPLLSEKVPDVIRKSILQELRIAWTRNSYYLNRQRASGSISPRYPELDANGPFAYAEGQKEFPEAPRFAPYEGR